MQVSSRLAIGAVVGVVWLLFPANLFGQEEAEAVMEEVAPKVAADLALALTDSPDPVSAGTPLIYTVTVTNRGPSDARDVTVDGALPKGARLGETGGCAEDPRGAPTCSLGTVPAGETRAYKLVVDVDRGFAGPISFRARVASATPESAPGDEAVTEITAVSLEGAAEGADPAEVPAVPPGTGEGRRPRGPRVLDFAPDPSTQPTTEPGEPVDPPFDSTDPSGPPPDPTDPIVSSPGPGDPPEVPDRTAPTPVPPSGQTTPRGREITEEVTSVPTAPDLPWLAIGLVAAVAALAALGFGVRRVRVRTRLREEYLGARDGQQWKRMYELIEKMPPALANSPPIRQQQAFALNRDGLRDQAERVLRELLQRPGPHLAETFGLLGRVHKDRWDEVRASGDAAAARALLDESVRTYLEGHDADPANPYPGINALTLMSFYDTPHERRETLLEQVASAVSARSADPEPDYWSHATRLELAMHQNDEEGARAALAMALAAPKVVWMVVSTRRNLRLVREARETRGEPVPEWYKSVEATLEQEIAGRR